MNQQIATLQEQVNSLFTTLDELRSSKPPLETLGFDAFSGDASPSLTLSSGPPLHHLATGTVKKHPRFQGPTSSAFSFDVAKSSLQSIGIAAAEESVPDDLTTAHPSPVETPRHLAPLCMTTVHPSKDPIWSIKRHEAIRLCRVYEEEMGLMYPIFEIDTVISQTNQLYTFLEAATRSGSMRQGSPADCLQDDNTTHLKLILAITLMVEGNGQSELGQHLFSSVKPIVHMKMWEPVDIKIIQLFSLVVSIPFSVARAFVLSFFPIPFLLPEKVSVG
jgi:hypothetical protein